MGKDGSASSRPDLAALAIQALWEVGGMAKELIMVRECDNVVYLSGRIGNYRAKRAAEQAVARIPGVKHVSNGLRVAPQMLRSDAWLSSEVGMALTGDPLMPSLRADVVIRDGMVFLRGEAGSLRERTAAVERAWSVLGVRDVHVGLTVQDGYAWPADTVLAQDVSRQVAHALGAEGGHADVAIQHGVTNLHGASTEEERRCAGGAVRRDRRLVGIVNQQEGTAEHTQTSQLSQGKPVLEQQGADAARLGQQQVLYRGLA